MFSLAEVKTGDSTGIRNWVWARSDDAGYAVFEPAPPIQTELVIWGTEVIAGATAQAEKNRSGTYRRLMKIPATLMKATQRELRLR